MAIIDSQNVFLDGPVRESAASQVVALTSLCLPGRMEAMPLRISVTEAYKADELAALTLTLQEADSVHAPDAQWSDVPGASYTMTADKLTAGARLPWRFLPEGVSKRCVRLYCTVTAQDGASVSQGALFAALLREEDFPYTPAQKVGGK